MNTTTQETIPQTVARLRNYFNTGKTHALEFRQQQLRGIERFLNESQEEIFQALFQDLGKPTLEAFTTDFAFILAELNLIQKKLPSWIKPKRAKTSLWAQPGKTYIYQDPLGVALIIAPWNFPIQLSLIPVIGAIAAGNCVILKPSEIAPATSKLLATKLSQYVDPECLRVVEGDATVATALLAQQYDYIFYTGNGTVGRIVMQAAAQHLTPVTLELGGKSPCIVDQDVDLEVAARRILLGKCYNAGQVCVAPDYVLVHEAVEAQLLACMKKVLREFYGDHPEKNPDYARIINPQHFQRLMKLLPGSGDVFIGGETDEQNRYIAPTILHNVPADSPIMQEEIFGPILPVIKVKNIKQAMEFVKRRPKPLSLYIFSNDVQVQNKVLEFTTSGSAGVNCTSLQFLMSLPSGGVGESGMGAYHGKATFETFSHQKTVLKKTTAIDLKVIYPPYNKIKYYILRIAFLWRFW